MKIRSLGPLHYLSAFAISLLIPASLFGQAQAQAKSKGLIVEEIIAHVNNSIITLSDFQKADATLREEVAHECQACTPDKLDAAYRDRQKDLLRDLIDQQLLIQRGKDEGISVETDLIKRLDDVRKENKLGSLEELEKAVEGEGLSWEDYKSQIRNNLLTQEVIGREMRNRIVIGKEEVKKYYDEHQSEFVRPELVVLSDIFLSTEGKSPEEMAVIQRKMEDYRNRLVKGEEFSELAKRYSEGPTGKEGGNIGTFERGQLSKQLEEAVFALNRGGMTEIIQTKTGFEVLKVVEHFQAGQQPLEKVENEIMNKIYLQRMQPTMREYLATLREESYVLVKPGFTDTAAVAGASAIQEVSPTPDAPQKGKKKSSKSKAGS